MVATFSVDILKNKTILLLQMNDLPIVIRYADGTYDHSFIMSAGMQSNADVLELIFAGFNHGSGHEWPMFLKSKSRSLSVGDFVSICGTWYRCEGCGWKVVMSKFVNHWFVELERRVNSNTNTDLRIARWTSMADMTFEYDTGTFPTPQPS